MATITGTTLLSSVLESTGVQLNVLLTATLTAKLQQMLDNGTYSSLASAIAMSGFSSELNARTEVLELSNTIKINADLIEAAADDSTINLSATDVSTHQGTNGIAETFIYEIDSTNFIIESRESDNISLQGFNVLEDKLIFQDVATGTTSTAFFIDDALMSSASDTQITFEALLVNNDDIVIAEDGFSLTLVGITDFSAIDYIVV